LLPPCVNGAPEGTAVHPTSSWRSDCLLVQEAITPGSMKACAI
jgi:hypothetical protein